MCDKCELLFSVCDNTALCTPQPFLFIPFSDFIDKWSYASDEMISHSHFKGMQ